MSRVGPETQNAPGGDVAWQNRSPSCQSKRNFEPRDGPVALL